MPTSKGSRRWLGREALLEWYAPRRRAYPWITSREPYAVLVSEVMLQQTQAPRVAVAYRAFLARFPTVGSLAEAPRREVLLAWEGLGYNRRAVALSEAARTIVRTHGGRVPRDPRRLRELRGVGPYTAAAIASIAFGEPIAAIDTNVRRVTARAHLGLEGHEVAPAEIVTLANAWLDRRDPGIWNQAVMDLGREVCRPTPRCEVCPLEHACRFRRLGAPVRPHPRPQPPFAGSEREVRGAVVRLLCRHRVLTLGSLGAKTGFPPPRVVSAVRGLAVDGLVDAGPAAIDGRSLGRVGLAAR